MAALQLKPAALPTLPALLLWHIITAAAFTLFAGVAAEELACERDGLLRNSAYLGSLRATAACGSVGSNCTFVIGSQGFATALANLTVGSNASHTGTEVWVFGAAWRLTARPAVAGVQIGT